MIVGSIKEDLALEKRVSLTPDSAKNIIGLGLKVCIEEKYATHLGIGDNEYEKVGVEIKSSPSEVSKSSNLIIKVNCPSEDEISILKENTILIGMFNPSKNKNQINKIINKKIKKKWTTKDKEMQYIKRGRYVEFNLLYDRGTKFGLQTGGNTEGILMSLPPLAKWK